MSRYLLIFILLFISCENQDKQDKSPAHSNVIETPAIPDSLMQLFKKIREDTSSGKLKDTLTNRTLSGIPRVPKNISNPSPPAFSDILFDNIFHHKNSFNANVNELIKATFALIIFIISLIFYYQSGLFLRKMENKYKHWLDAFSNLFTFICFTFIIGLTWLIFYLFHENWLMEAFFPFFFIMAMLPFAVAFLNFLRIITFIKSDNESAKKEKQFSIIYSVLALIGLISNIITITVYLRSK